MEANGRKKDDLKMSPEKVRDLVKCAKTLGQFPPQIVYPENSKPLLEENLFGIPYLIWIPEVLEAGGIPTCAFDACECIPSVKEYRQRVVEDVRHKTLLLFVRYKCNGNDFRERGFNTWDRSYLKRCGTDAILRFPYLLTHCHGISKEMYEMVHDGIMSSNGE